MGLLVVLAVLLLAAPASASACGPRPALDAACGDFSGDKRADALLADRERPPIGATRWVAYRRASGGWRRVASGRVAGLLDVSVRRGRARISYSRWRRDDVATCPTGGRVTQVLRGGRLRTVSRVAIGRGCGPMPPACRPSAGRPDIGVSVNPFLSDDTLGKVLPGTQLRSTVAPHLDPRPEYRSPMLAHYPGGEATWVDVPDPSLPRYVLPSRATVFNGDGARHRVAHDQAYAGLSPIGIGDIDGDGIEDLAQTAHWSTVDGVAPVGEVHIFLGRRERLDARRHIPDVVLYGDATFDKFGIEVAPAGDFDGDGFDDFLISAAFRRIADRYGSAYLVYGGPGLLRYRCPVKVRATDIGTKIPGALLEGGHDGASFVGWTNTLDSGDFDGDGLSDLLLGAYDMHVPRKAPSFKARAYVIYGGSRLRGTVPLGRGPVIELPDERWANSTTGFQTSFVGDLDGDGRDEIAISGAPAGEDGRGRTWIFRGRRLPPGVTPVGEADLTVVPDGEHTGLAGARPAGDVNGDGRPDVQLSVRNSTVDGNLVGAVGVLHGAHALPREVRFSELPVVLFGSRTGSSAGFPGMNTGADLDGDGYADLLVNDPYFSEQVGGATQYRGRVWMVRGGPAMRARAEVEAVADRVFLADTALPGLFGFQWNTGDFDADGRADVLVGDHYLGDEGTRERPGGAYLYWGGSF